MLSQKGQVGSEMVEEVGDVATQWLFKPRGTYLQPGDVVSLLDSTRDGSKRMAVVERVETFEVDAGTRAIFLGQKRVELDALMALADVSLIRLDEMIDAIHGVGEYSGGAQAVFLKQGERNGG